MVSQQEKAEAIKQWLSKTRVETAIRGQRVSEGKIALTPLMFLDISKRVIAVSSGTEKPDNRDDLRHSTFLGVEDFIKEHIEKDVGRLQHKAKMKMDQKKNLDWMSSGFFNNQIRKVIVGNSISQNIEGVNPIEHWDVAHKVTKLGPGGIEDTDAIPKESRDVDASQFGFFDVLHMPENETIGVTNYLTHNVRKGMDGKIYRLVLDKKKKPVWIDHETFITSKIEIMDE